MRISIPEPEDTEHYERIPFKFAQEFSASNVFLKLPDGFSPLERMVLQATGNLQRLLSAYFNVPSRVVILKNELVTCCDNYNSSSIYINMSDSSSKSTGTWISASLQQEKESSLLVDENDKSDDGGSIVIDVKSNDHIQPCADNIEQGDKSLDMLFHRKILMYFGDKLAYEADSLVSVKDPQILSLLAKHEYGLGQIFSHARHTPSFALKSVGRHGNNNGQSFWRDYTLVVPAIVECYIREIFVDDLFELHVNSSKNIIRNRQQGTVWYNPDDNEQTF
ncbi:hypothetical protein INT45_008504 [Circinella minor]|uniref:Uncharacterized protein n=1 Tax=Circinella minor TaxID=1195481 RepID=A0A8H7SCZ1_9FUNG|nr:hypothetical protein INT45_008504 [Circinella minor]